MENYLEINKNSWNCRVDPHLKSDFYFFDEFLKGRNCLNSIELELLGDIKEKSILHLKCHSERILFHFREWEQKLQE